MIIKNTTSYRSATNVAIPVEITNEILAACGPYHTHSDGVEYIALTLYDSAGKQFDGCTISHNDNRDDRETFDILNDHLRTHQINVDGGRGTLIIYRCIITRMPSDNELIVMEFSF